jgi:hypothetical protein
MACFTPALLQQFLIWLVLVVALVAIVNLVVPWLLAQFGSPPDGGMILRILQIIVWAVVAIAVIYFVFDLLTCSGLFTVRR